MTAADRSPESFPAALFISYDGLLDPLGGSQILPYVFRLAESGYRMGVVSFEKPERYQAAGAALQEQLAARGIAWSPLRFTHGGGAFGKLRDLTAMYREVWHRARHEKVTILHARGHPAAQVARFVKHRTGARFLFDFRGLWADERVDKGGWDLRRTAHRWQYAHFKRTERKLLKDADAVVVLTQAVVPEVRRLGLPESTPVTVIPCCADFEHFSLAAPAVRSAARSSCGIPADAVVLGYLGSVGKMYMIDRVCRLFALAAARRADLWILFVTHDRAALQAVLDREVAAPLQARVRIVAATREQVPQLLATFDLLVSFIRPSYARTAASPTRLAEAFATGLPTITNGGVGDVAEQVRALDAGVIVDPEADSALEEAIAQIDRLRERGGERLRAAARPLLGLDHAAAQYARIYAMLKGTPCST
jgi:glycosyltransferase involved in cell wall biosynthesis